MNYAQTLDFLFSQLPMYQRVGSSAYKANLDNTRALDTYFNHPHKFFKTIHIAGTNGKGSVSHMLASIMQEAGLKTGLYTSPHLVDFRERIKINGECIPETEVVDFVKKHGKILDELKPSFFEMTVAMALNYFKEQQVDIAVIEVGMGGRLDSTNIIQPLVSIVTNIGYDHTQFLGVDLASIAAEKAGIIKKNVPVFIGEYHEETAPVFIKKSSELDAPICFSERRFHIRKIANSSKGQEFTVKNEQSGTSYHVTLDLMGSYQQKNLIPVFGALQVLTPGLNLPKDAIISGLAKVVQNTGLQGRWQQVQVNPKVIADTGHNLEGLTEVVNQLKMEKYNRLFFIFGTVNDKDLTKALKILPVDATYLFTQASIPRALNYEVLTETANKAGLTGSAFPEVKLAYQHALQMANEDDLIFIGGSTFIVADLFKSLLGEDI